MHTNKLSGNGQIPLPIFAIGHLATRSAIDADRLADSGEIVVGSTEWVEMRKPSYAPVETVIYAAVADLRAARRSMSDLDQRPRTADNFIYVGPTLRVECHRQSPNVWSIEARPSHTYGPGEWVYRAMQEAFPFDASVDPVHDDFTDYAGAEAFWTPCASAMEAC